MTEVRLLQTDCFNFYDLSWTATYWLFQLLWPKSDCYVLTLSTSMTWVRLLRTDCHSCYVPNCFNCCELSQTVVYWLFSERSRWSRCCWMPTGTDTCCMCCRTKRPRRWKTSTTSWNTTRTMPEPTDLCELLSWSDDTFGGYIHRDTIKEQEALHTGGLPICVSCWRSQVTFFG